MKAITLTQPWATLVAIGAKRIETRTWSTNYRGPLAIHAAKGFPRDAIELALEEPFRSTLARAGVKRLDDLPRGAVVATARLVECRSTTPDMIDGSWVAGLSDLEDAFGDYSPGRYGWVLADVEPLAEPVPARGALGLWNWQLKYAALAEYVDDLGCSIRQVTTSTGPGISEAG
jgi:hypothetical protein